MRNVAVEELIERGIMDERDVDYLDHLEIPIPEVDDVALEGIIRANIHDSFSVNTDMYRQLKGWFLGVESKRKYIEEICTDLIDWLKDKDIDYPDLDLDMGTFKTWMKTSESFFFRYYFLLNNDIWNKIVSDINNGRITELENLYTADFTAIKATTNHLDSVTTIKELIKLVELYVKRSNQFFEMILKRKVKVKSAPFQVILLGATDLRQTTKKIVNLAI